MRNKKIISLFLWILIWQLVAMGTKNSILLPDIIQTAKSLISILTSTYNWLRIGKTIIEILSGYALALFFGILFGFISFFKPKLQPFIQIPVNFMKSIPVVCLVIILLIYSSSKILPLFVVWTMVFPQIYTSVLDGAKNTDKKLLELSYVYNIKRKDIFIHIYLHQIISYLAINAKISMGFAWKSGVAAEVIAMTQMSMGEAVYTSKIYLSTDELFAWTILILLLSKLSELLVDICIRRIKLWS